LAATAGHAGAQINLATMYLDGAGVPRDPAASGRLADEGRGQR
jgi:TPR repeat protein